MGCHAYDLERWRGTTYHHLSDLSTPANSCDRQTMKQNLAAKKKQLNTMKQERTLQSGPCFRTANVLSLALEIAHLVLVESPGSALKGVHKVPSSTCRSLLSSPHRNLVPE